MVRRQSAIRPALLAVLMLAAGQPVLAQAAPKAAVPHVMDAWVRLPAVSGRPAGGYFMAHGTATADALVSVTSPRAERIEMHSMANENGVMKMRKEESFALPAKGTLTFAPGGSHLMLFGLSPEVKPGTKVPLTFRFKSGATVTLDAEARAASAAVAPPAKASDPAHQH
jgi:copper(I)-binding protein